ncbi:hypothetical protein A4H97_32765 [Niastella yeongjuensis]|uniref:FecR family protein n=1 Tax=Niastella yeongjuensis TaxID=354355 RepID=A0A1V9EGN3_9BACT|nr:FecR domain-containing protein [Niastella yeongjuensis]OQP45290.1 hypothetical protein A4H97_32765 [Niastella yeongjuensis]SEO27022.1 FecR family protein [Niastella yeongjuensis]
MAYSDMEQMQRIIYLLSGHIKGNLNFQETRELENWIADKPENRALFEKLQDKGYRDQLLAQWQPQAAEQSLQRVKQKIASQQKPARWPRWAAAASLLLALAAAGYYILLHKQPLPVATKKVQQPDVAPGRNQATLTLADGRKIVLTRELNGQLALQGQTTITANNKDGIVYTTGSTSTATSISWNTLTTARGEQSPYPLTLPDGSKVWLNAASTITFPTVFNAHARTVKITGEVYFEVEHNEKHPFRVEVKDQLIEDIGTHFNVNAYDDEPASKTTLLEGSVRVGRRPSYAKASAGEAKEKDQSVILKPGEQAVSAPHSPLTIDHSPDLDEAMAWKEGMFRFSSEDLGSIMRTISRWYNVEIVFADPAARSLRFGALVNRFANVSQILRMLELTKEVHFKIEDKKIIVMKN